MPTVRSLKDFAFDSLEAFLYREGFPNDTQVVNGIAYLANNICQYQEESLPLRPEVLITTNIADVAGTLPTRMILPIEEGPVAAMTFKKALKACAPLAQENWII